MIPLGLKSKFSRMISTIFSSSYYWQSESPTYNKEALMSILSEQKVDKSKVVYMSIHKKLGKQKKQIKYKIAWKISVV